MAWEKFGGVPSLVHCADSPNWKAHCQRNLAVGEPDNIWELASRFGDDGDCRLRVGSLLPKRGVAYFRTTSDNWCRLCRDSRNVHPVLAP